MIVCDTMDIKFKTYLGLFIILLSCIQTSFGASFVDIGNLPATVTVFEDVKTSTFLHSMTSYPTSAMCTIAPGSNFQIASTGGVHKISTIASPTFDHSSTPTYTLVIQCESAPATSSGTLTVNLVDNVAPTVTNLPGVVTISAKTAKTNHVIYTISYTDPDTNPPLAYTSFTTAPASGPFALENDQLKVTADLLSTTVASYVVSFTYADERNTASSSITIAITDINYAPDFILPIDVTLSLPEDQSGRLQLYDIDHNDANGDSVQYTYQTSEANNHIFDLVGATGEIYLIHGYSFDYENITAYTFKVLIEDYLSTGTATFTLTLSITNVNERPTYSGEPNNVTVAESASGTSIGTLSVLCTDPDGDALTYSIIHDTYTSYFTIADPTTPTISFANTWDFDSTLPAVLNLTVRCSDPGGFSDDAIYTVKITDINDNDPICTPSQTVFNLLYNQAVNETLMKITCTDADSTFNANLTFAPVGLTSGYTVTYFNVDVNGTVFIKTTFTMDYNTTFYVTILITDRGTPSRSATITLTVTFTMEPTIIIHEAITRCFFCTTASLAIVAAAGFIGFIMVTIAIYLLIIKKCYDREQKKMIRNLQKKKKEKWRWFGCLRPGHRNKPKKSKEEIKKQELRDQEYMRARNALKGNNDPAYLQARNAMLGPETTSVPIETSSGRQIPSKLPKKPYSSKREKVDSRKFLEGRVIQSPISVITGRPTGSSIGRESVPSGYPTASFIGRERAPSDVMETYGSEEHLTGSQREQLDKFRDFKKEKEQQKNGMTESSSRQMKGQAANDMTWTFQGR